MNTTDNKKIEKQIKAPNVVFATNEAVNNALIKSNAKFGPALKELAKGPEREPK